jgi:uncharacterized small protein (DUF1192 family)
MKTGLKNEVFVDKLLISGSSALKKKNNNINLFEEIDTEDGIVSSKLTKPRYNKEQLIKSIDTTIIELLPVEVPELPDMVLRSIYNEALAEIEARDRTIRDLNQKISELESRIRELEAEIENLRAELDAEKILAASYQNTNQQSVSKVQTSITDLQNSLQRATSEAIQRVSLTARVEALAEENARLKDVLEGKQAKQAEGAKVGMDISVKVINKAEQQYPDLTFRGRAKDDGNGSWINGPDIEFYNFSTEDVTVNFSQTGDANGMIDMPKSFTIKPKETIKIAVKNNAKRCDSFAPSAGVGTSRDKSYTANLVVKTNKSTLNIPMALQKQRGNKFEP